MTLENTVILGDCLDILPTLPASSVNCVVCDLPYGQTKNEWDSEIDLQWLWGQYNRVCTTNAAVILFGQGMFTAGLMTSNAENWRYNIVWEKDRSTGFLNASKMPLRCHEDIVVFYREQPPYHPQMVEGDPIHGIGYKARKNNCYGKFHSVDNKGDTDKHPRSVLFFPRPHPPIHPTQKPQELYEWLIRTYTDEGDLVLDNCCGVGTCAAACSRANRRYLCIERDPKYHEIAVRAATSASVPRHQDVKQSAVLYNLFDLEVPNE